MCTGSLVLAAAGLLNGYRATSHWAVADLLPLMGAIRASGRVVVDRNRMTGGSVTAGIDFGLLLLASLRDAEMARRAQLAVEYAPQPPIDAGEPASASAELVAKVRAGRLQMDSNARSAAEEAARRRRSG